jgi:uncharacterized protein
MANTTGDGQENGRSNRGFAALKKRDPERQREIARQGGKAAHEKGSAHEFTSETGRLAGQKGGRRSRGRGSEPPQ